MMIVYLEVKGVLIAKYLLNTPIEQLFGRNFINDSNCLNSKFESGNSIK
jgi:hypothetical protein